MIKNNKKIIVILGVFLMGKLSSMGSSGCSDRDAFMCMPKGEFDFIFERAYPTLWIHSSDPTPLWVSQVYSKPIEEIRISPRKATELLSEIFFHFWVEIKLPPLWEEKFEYVIQNGANEEYAKDQIRDLGCPLQKVESLTKFLHREISHEELMERVLDPEVKAVAEIEISLKVGAMYAEDEEERSTILERLPTRKISIIRERLRSDFPGPEEFIDLKLIAREAETMYMVDEEEVDTIREYLRANFPGYEEFIDHVLEDLRTRLTD